MISKTKEISILYVEDDEAIREDMNDFLNRRFEHVFQADNGSAGYDAYLQNLPDIIMTDIRMPVMDGLEMIRAILKVNDKAIVIVTSAHNEAKYLLGAIELGISHYLMKPLETEKLEASLKHCVEIVSNARTLNDREKNVAEAFLYTITSLARAAEVNDEDTGNHILRVGEYCAAICRKIGYSEEMASTMEQQSHLHDVGKIHVPPDILKKPGKLTDAEMLLMQEHPVSGAEIIGAHPRLEIARTIALHHHERWNGSGYPAGLRGTAIPVDARILAIADTYDALRSKRSYKPAFDHDTAWRIIVEGDGRTEPTHFDPDMLRVFKKVCTDFDEIYQRLATGEI